MLYKQLPKTKKNKSKKNITNQRKIQGNQNKARAEEGSLLEKQAPKQKQNGNMKTIGKQKKTHITKDISYHPLF